jgi:hypothetical protein
MSGVSLYNITSNSDISGGEEIKSISTTNIDTCANECSNNKECIGFTVKSGKCSLVKIFENVISDNSSTLYIKKTINTDQKPENLECVYTADESATELQKLQACKDAMICYGRVIYYNQSVTNYNDKQKAKLKAMDAVWERRKKIRSDEQTAWDTRKNNIYNDKINERRLFKNCVLWTSVWDDYCPTDHGNGWYREPGSQDGHGCIGGQGKAKCRRTAQQASAETNNEIVNEKGPRPKNYEEDESKPTQTSFPLLEQNVTSINLQCCSNYMNVLGTAKDNVQSCKQQLEININQATSTTPPSTTSTTPPSTTSTTPPSTIQPLIPEKSITSNEENSLLASLFIISVIAIITSISLSSVSIVITNKKIKN